MYPHLEEVLSHLWGKRFVKRIQFVANGTLIPKQDVLKVIGYRKVTVLIGNYGEKSAKMDELKALIWQNGVKFRAIDFSRWMDYGELSPKGLTRKELAESFRHCPTSECKPLLNVRICAETQKLFLKRRRFWRAHTAIQHGTGNRFRRGRRPGSEVEDMESMSKKAPKVSVVVPMYNARDSISRCAESVKAQSFSGWELIVVDNNSADGSAEICEQTANGDRRIRVVFEGRQGVSCARNRGIDEAAGEFVFFLDADDELAPNALELFIAEAEGRNCDIVAANIEHVILDADGNVRRRFSHPPRPLRADSSAAIAQAFCDQLPVYGLFSIFMLYRRALVEKNSLRFDEELSLGEDMLFNLSAYQSARRLTVLKESLYKYYHKHGENLNMKYRPDMLKIKSRLFDSVKKYLEQNGCFGDVEQCNFYTMYTQEAFLFVSNIFRDPQYEKRKARQSFAEIKNLPDVRETIRLRRSLPISIGKRFFLEAMATGSLLPAHMAVRLYRLINRI